MGYELALTLKQEKCAGAIAAAPLQMLALSPPLKFCMAERLQESWRICGEGNKSH